MCRKGLLIIALLLYSCLISGGNTQEQILLHHINTKGYLVRVIYRDANGIMWLGTTSGLITLPQLESRNPSGYHRSLGDVNMSIKRISGDHKGRLWIKTLYNENYLYDPQRNEFIEDTPSMFSQKGIDISREFTVLADSEDRIWIWKDNRLYWTKGDGPKAGMVSLSADNHFSNVWPGKTQLTALSQKSLCRISTERQRVVQTIPLPSGYNLRDHLFVASDDTPWIWALNKAWRIDGVEWQPAIQVASDITGIAQDDEGRLWISTQSDGIYICDHQGSILTHLQHTEGNAYGLLSNHVESIGYEPASQTMWIAYTKGGLSVYAKRNEDLLLYQISDPADQKALTDVLTFAPAKGKGIWIGLEQRGVWLHDSQGDRNVINGGSAVSLYACDNGELWAGIYRHGLVCRSADGQQKLYLEGTSPYAITEDGQGNIFTALLGNGVWQLDPATGKAINTRLKPKYVFDLKYHQQKLYAASTEGLYIRDSHQQWKLLNDGHFHYLTIDPNGYIWLIGNEGSEGLTLLDPAGQPINLPEDLKTAPLRSITRDDAGNIWTATSSELLMLRYNPKAEEQLERHSFKVNAEGQQIFYNFHISFIDDNGILWLGATTGYQGIDTRRLTTQTQEKSAARTLVLGAISINDNILSPGQPFNGRILLDKDVTFIRELHLRYNENNLVIECSQPSIMGYATDAYYYQLKGFSDVWHPLEGGTIILSNLPPGDYELLTRTPSSEAYRLLNIHIAPPYWLSWWAFCIYILLAAAAIFGILRYYRNRRSYQLQLRELQLQQEQQKQMNEMKLRFFTNISHDLRTPLSLIISPVEELLKNEKARVKGEGSANFALDRNEKLKMIHRNAQHLLQLVNQILDFRRLEYGREKVVLSYGDIVSWIKEICDTFRLKAEKDYIKFAFQPMVERVETMFDHDKTTKIMMNLLSNAFKFTPNGGTIRVGLDISDGQVIITVSDNGIGINDEEKEHIFDRFYQSDNLNRASMGSGIGLHIVREYIKLQGGDIFVTDNEAEGHGSIFRFHLPLQKRSTSPIPDNKRENEPMSMIENTDADNEEQKQESDYALPLILVADDNSDLLDYMKQSLATEFRVMVAADGQEALQLIQQNDVDILVSDVMMPKMDGLELCRRVKYNIETSHIPVVLLTAKAMTSDELTGLEAGADDYITKPFSMDILRQRIHNLVERSRNRHERFATEMDIEPSEITVTSLDEQFIAKALAIVEEHIGEPEFSVEQLSGEMGVHRAQLYKKLFHLTGKTPQQFIRILRLKRGKQLLEQSGLYVSEVAYKVGFNSPRIFSKYFKEEFGVTPKDYGK